MDWDMLANEWNTELLNEWGLDIIKHDWDDLDYIEEEVQTPNLSKNTIVITIPDEYLDVRVKLTEDLKDWFTQNYLGCEVK